MNGEIPAALNRDPRRCPRCRELNCITDHEATDKANETRNDGYPQGLMQIIKYTWASYKPPT